MLQGSLMIATSRVVKNVEYFHENTFFEELSQYRTEISDSISNYRFSDTLVQLKRIIGYHYTYKIMINKEEQRFTERILNQLIAEVTKDETISLIEKFSQNEPIVNKNTYQLMLDTHDSIRRILLKIYNITNKNLSERKILPKIIRKIHIDKTLI
jgi:hypothetical protein